MEDSEDVEQFDETKSDGAEKRAAEKEALTEQKLESSIYQYYQWKISKLQQQLLVEDDDEEEEEAKPSSLKVKKEDNDNDKTSSTVTTTCDDESKTLDVVVARASNDTVVVKDSELEKKIQNYRNVIDVLDKCGNIDTSLVTDLSLGDIPGVLVGFYSVLKPLETDADAEDDEDTGNYQDDYGDFDYDDDADDDGGMIIDSEEEESKKDSEGKLSKEQVYASLAETERKKNVEQNKDVEIALLKDKLYRAQLEMREEKKRVTTLSEELANTKNDKETIGRTAFRWERRYYKLSAVVEMQCIGSLKKLQQATNSVIALDESDDENDDNNNIRSQSNRTTAIAIDVEDDQEIQVLNNAQKFNSSMGVVNKYQGKYDFLSDPNKRKSLNDTALMQEFAPATKRKYTPRAKSLGNEVNRVKNVIMEKKNATSLEKFVKSLPPKKKGKTLQEINEEEIAKIRKELSLAHGKVFAGKNKKKDPPTALSQHSQYASVSSGILGNQNNEDSRQTYHDDKWEGHFQKFKAFVNRVGMDNVSTLYKYDSYLYDWITIQRRYFYNKIPILTPERIEKLNSINFPWKSQRVLVPFETRIEQCLKFRTEHGHLTVPTIAELKKHGMEPTTKDERDFLNWAEQIRIKYKKRTLDGNKNILHILNVNALDEIKFDWRLQSTIDSLKKKL
jgi:Helicase associated domain